MDTSLLFQSLSWRRPKNMLTFYIFFCSMLECKHCWRLWCQDVWILAHGLVWHRLHNFPLPGCCRVRLEHHLCLVMLIFKQNFDDAVASASPNLWVSYAEWAISALSSTKSSSPTNIYIYMVFGVKCVTVKKSSLWCACM